MPSLAERRSDIPLLADAFLKRYQLPGLPPRRFSDDAIELLERYHWPGNVRELENLVERVAILNSDNVLPVEVLKEHVPNSPGDPQPVTSPAAAAIIPFKSARNQFEREWLEMVLKISSHNLSEAARLAKMDRAQFFRLAKRHKLTGNR